MIVSSADPILDPTWSVEELTLEDLVLASWHRPKNNVAISYVRGRREVTWFAWRQFRFQALVVPGLLVAIVVFFLITGPHLRRLFDA